MSYLYIRRIAHTLYPLLICQIYTSPTQTNEDDSHKILDRYTELGGNMIDTSNLYSLGKSEQIIGRWLAKYVWIVTIYTYIVLCIGPIKLAYLGHFVLLKCLYQENDPPRVSIWALFLLFFILLF